MDVCTNAACAKLGAKNLMANLVEVRERAGCGARFDGRGASTRAAPGAWFAREAREG